jgi:hypothetical protein
VSLLRDLSLMRGSWWPVMKTSTRGPCRLCSQILQRSSTGKGLKRGKYAGDFAIVLVFDVDKVHVMYLRHACVINISWPMIQLGVPDTARVHLLLYSLLNAALSVCYGKDGLENVLSVPWPQNPKVMTKGVRWIITR